MAGSLGSSGASTKLTLTASHAAEGTLSHRTRRSGTEQLHVNFGSTGAAFRRLAAAMNGKRLWILLDEWSSVPGELQPYLADLLRRSLFATPGATVKIAAIEQRAHFQLPPSGGDYVGIEIGADASADINLDDFMVFDNDADRSSEFFRDLLFRHFSAIAPEAKISSAAELIRQAFTQVRAFEEFVRASGLGARVDLVVRPARELRHTALFQGLNRRALERVSTGEVPLHRLEILPPSQLSNSIKIDALHKETRRERASEHVKSGAVNAIIESSLPKDLPDGFGCIDPRTALIPLEKPRIWPWLAKALDVESEAPCEPCSDGYGALLVRLRGPPGLRCHPDTSPSEIDVADLEVQDLLVAQPRASREE